MRKHAVLLGLAALSATLAVTPPADPAVAAGPTQPNVVFILLDDVSENLLPYMSAVTDLAAHGATFENFFDATPWCCPSRASIQTGQFPHNTNVKSNGWPDGGFGQFLLNDIDATVGTAMHDAGYRTGLMGKYLNQYDPSGDSALGGPPEYPAAYVPPGWDTWISGDAYQQFAYKLTVDVSGTPSVMRARGIKPKNYFTDVLARQAVKFISSPDPDPFFLMLAPWAAHQNFGEDPEGPDMLFPPAPRDRAASPTRPTGWPAPDFPQGDCGPVSCDQVPWPETPLPANYDTLITDAPSWMPTTVLSPEEVATSRTYYIQRIQMLQSINDMIVSIRAALASTGESDNTWIIVASDNGFHLGEHGLPFGKTSALDHDVKVPLVVYPAGGSEPETISAIVQNVDLFPTIADIGGAALPADVDGASMLSLLADGGAPSWRTAALLELKNNGSADLVRNPDTSGPESTDLAPTYNAIRTPEYLYVDYSVIDGVMPPVTKGEFYDLAADPAMLHNIYGQLADADRLALNTKLREYTSCVGAACVTAGSDYPHIG